MNPNDEATALLDAWLRGCEPAVQLSVADHERLRTSVAQALAQRATEMGTADRLAVAVAAYQAAQGDHFHQRPAVYLAAYNLALALEQYRRWWPGSEAAAPEATLLSSLGWYHVADGMGGNG